MAAKREAVLPEDTRPSLSPLGFAFVDSSPGARQAMVALIAGMGLLSTITVVLGRNPGPRITAFLPLVTGSVIVTELLSALLLLGQFRRTRALPLLFIGSGYLFAALVAVPYVLTFPRVFAPDGLFHANGQTALYLWIAWHGGFPLFLLAGALSGDSARGLSVNASRALVASALAGCAAFAYVAASTLIAAGAHLPVLVVDTQFTSLATGGVLPVICLIDSLAIVALVSRTRIRTVADVWLTVALVASLLDTIMGLVCARYSYGWYLGKIFSMVASSVVVIAFVHEITALQAKLARLHDDLLQLSALERRAARKRLLDLAYNDQLTRLPNRTRWQAELGKAVSHATEGRTRFATLFMDLDRFKGINDTAGHAMGDRVLAEVANRLRSAVRPGDIVGRFGGDEFVVLVPGVTDRAEVTALASRLRNCIRKPFEFGQRTFHLAASIGISLFPDDGLTPENLLHRADAACNQAKRSRDCELFYSDEIGTELSRRHDIYQGLARAIADGGFSLHYQPLYDLRTKRIESVEALVRWTDANGDVVPAAAFIPIAEQSGLMDAIGHWVLGEALRQVQAWAELGLALRVAINISATQLQERNFFPSLERALAGAHVDPRFLEIEVTESATLADPVMGRAQLAKCRQAGIRVSLDDFGTHYSSLTYLQKLPIDSIKIDRSFIGGLPFNSSDVSIVRAVIMLGHELGRTIVAEGIETAEHLKWLQTAGCDVAQGYHIARPMPASLLTAWFAEREDWIRLAGRSLKAT